MYMREYCVTGVKTVGGVTGFGCDVEIVGWSAGSRSGSEVEGVPELGTGVAGWPGTGCQTGPVGLNGGMEVVF